MAPEAPHPGAVVHAAAGWPAFAAAAETLACSCESGRANLAARFQETALDALCRALFSVPAGTAGTMRLPDLVREFLVTVGRPSLWDMLARKEGDFAWSGRGRADIGRRWFADIDPDGEPPVQAP